MNAPKELPPPTNKMPLPYLTLIGATLGLLIPLGGAALLFWATQSEPTQAVLSSEQKLRELRAAEDRQLTTYGWIEKPAGTKQGVVHIPLTSAKELFLNELTPKQKEGKKP
jgi:hypothetical protein